MDKRPNTGGSPILFSHSSFIQLYYPLHIVSDFFFLFACSFSLLMNDLHKQIKGPCQKVFYFNKTNHLKSLMK